MTETVVFIHGIYMVGLEFAPLRQRMAAAGFETRRFHYRSLARGPDENAARLAQFLGPIQSERLHLVAHSLGGLVVLRMFERGVKLPPGRVVFLGSPVRGSESARRMRSRGLGWLLGRSGPGALATAHAPRWTEPRELGVIAGTHEFSLNPFHGKLTSPHDGIVSLEETRIEGATDSAEIYSNHTGMLFQRELAEQVCGFLKRGEFRHSA